MAKRTRIRQGDTVSKADVDAAVLSFWSEKIFQSKVNDVLRDNGWIFHHARDSRRSIAGLLDIVAVRPPRVIFAELKVKGRKPRTRAQAAAQKVDAWGQDDWLAALRDCPGAEVYLWTPADYEHIKEVLA